MFLDTFRKSLLFKNNIIRNKQKDKILLFQLSF